MFSYFSLRRRVGLSDRANRTLSRIECPKSRRARQQFLRLIVEHLEDRSLLSTIMVTSLADNLTAGGGVTLREAIQAANTNASVDGSAAGQAAPVVDKIVFQAGLTGSVNLALGQFQITETVIIQGLGAAQTTINGQTNSRVFDISFTGGAVTFDGLTLTGGVTQTDSSGGGAIRSDSPGQLAIQNSTISGNSTSGALANGGGIYAGAVSVSNSTISGNRSFNGAGGGIFASSLTVSDSTISGNLSFGGAGGGIFATSPMSVTNSTISGNYSRGSGGGIFAFSSATITNSTISGNSTGGDSSDGGGIGAASVTITNSTLSGNFTIGTNASGGGISTYNSVTLTNSTITGNTVYGLLADGGGVHSKNGPVSIRNSIVAGNADSLGGGNAASPDLKPAGTLTVQYSLIGNNDGTGLAAAPVAISPGFNLIGASNAPIDPILGPLQNNGGPTNTRALLVASPAINAGDPAFAPPPNTDQRGSGFNRVSGGRIDMGAFEVFFPSSLVVDAAVDENDGNYNAGDFSLREAISIANFRTGAETISFAPAIAGQPILLTRGQLEISDPLTIQGLGALQTAVKAQNNSRLFDITAAAGDVTFDGLTLTGGKTFDPFERGGAIQSNSSGQLTIRSSVISGNATAGQNASGGGIFTKGSLAVINSAISGNSTAGQSAYGGGAYTTGALLLMNSTVSGNSTTGPGGYGGGILANASATVTNSTISGNSTVGSNAGGGGIFAYKSLTVTNSTITGNSVAGPSSGGGGLDALNGPVKIHNSIVAGNFDLQDSSHPDLRQFNGVPTLEFSLVGVDPRLAPLANNRGPTQTHALCTAVATPHASCTGASPALNTGSNALIPLDTLDLDGDGNTAEPIPFDQRGSPFPRVVDTTVDMGAFEFVIQNNAPTCTVIPVQANDEQPLQTVLNWIFNCTANDAGQTVGFAISTDKLSLFTSAPAVNANGTLTYDPAPNVHDTATVTITIQDNGGTANGGIDKTVLTYKIDITKPHRLFNAAESAPRRGLDVTGSTTIAPDGFIVAGDVLAVINYINAKGSGKIPDDSPYGPTYPDVTADNEVVAEDVIKIINYINAHPGQTEGDGGLAPADQTANFGADEVLLLLATDTAGLTRRGRRTG